jgi:hypothetical protein
MFQIEVIQIWITSNSIPLQNNFFLDYFESYFSFKSTKRLVFQILNISPFWDLKLASV